MIIICFVLGLIGLHDYINANSIHRDTINTNSSQNISEPMTFDETSKFNTINSDSQVKQHDVSDRHRHENNLSGAAIFGIVVASIIGFFILCVIFSFCLIGVKYFFTEM